MPTQDGSEKEWVNHPAHYGGADNDYEVIKVLEAWNLNMAKGFCWGSLIKYVARAEHKNGLEDYKKADWYATRLAEIEQKLVAGKDKPVVTTKEAPSYEFPKPLVPQPNFSIPAIGSEWIWEPGKHTAECRVKVVATTQKGISSTVKVLILEGPTSSISSTSIGAEYSHAVSRFWEAVKAPKREKGLEVA